MVQLLLLDRDCHYSRQVCARINSVSVRLHCSDFSSLEGISEAFCDIRTFPVNWEKTLLIYHPQQFFHPPENAYCMILQESSPCADQGSIPTSGFYKYSALYEMLRAIDAYIALHPELENDDRKASLMCVLGCACPDMRRQAISTVRQEKLRAGLQVVQIDFCPAYFSDFFTSDLHGASLSDALLRLSADDLPAEDLGTFLTPRPDGSLQFRPAERADDLFECEPSQGRKFVECVRRWIDHTGGRYFVILQCVAISFPLLYAVAVLCDEILLVRQDADALRTDSYHEEILRLLENLPGSCRLLEAALPCRGVLQKQGGSGA